MYEQRKDSPFTDQPASMLHLLYVEQSAKFKHRSHVSLLNPYTFTATDEKRKKSGEGIAVSPLVSVSS
jgi:hypothetical protein